MFVEENVLLDYENEKSMNPFDLMQSMDLIFVVVADFRLRKKNSMMVEDNQRMAMVNLSMNQLVKLVYSDKKEVDSYTSKISNDMDHTIEDLDVNKK
jgi:hypothetical protein